MILDADTLIGIALLVAAAFGAVIAWRLPPDEHGDSCGYCAYRKRHPTPTAATKTDPVDVAQQFADEVDTQAADFQQWEHEMAGGQR